MNGNTTLSSCLIWQIISFILSPNEYGCVYASLSGPAIDLQKMPILAKKNHLFKWSSFWSWWVCKQVKLPQVRHSKPARIHWKADAPKTSHCLVQILVQRNNWAIFLRKWARSRVVTSNGSKQGGAAGSIVKDRVCQAGVCRRKYIFHGTFSS